MFKNLHELITQMPDEKTCREWLIQQRWADGKPVCPYCGSGVKVYVIENGKRFKCGESQKICGKKFSVTIGTFLEGSNIPLNKWLMAIYVCTAHKKGISSYQLGKDIGVSQKSAWFMLHRIRAIMTEKQPEMLQGAVEVDETYMARKYKSDFVGMREEEIEFHLTRNAGRTKRGAVLGMAERGGNVRVIKFEGKEADPMKKAMKANIAPGSRLLTDEANMYKTGLNEYQHASVKHGAREWVRNDVHTNNIEVFWSVMKRGIHGIYHQISYKHLQQYCDEFSFRHNNRHLKDHEKFQLVFKGMIGRLPYKTLIATKNN